MSMLLAQFFGPIIVGSGLFMFASKCKGRNARNCFRYAAWATWLLLFAFAPITLIPIPIIGGMLNFMIRLVPSAVLYLMAISSLLKEIRAHQRGEFTEAA